MKDLIDIDILLIENNSADAEFTIEMIKENYLSGNILHVKSGKEAMDFLVTAPDHTPKIIIIDLKLPDINGIDLLRSVRANAATKEVPIVILTDNFEDKSIIDSHWFSVSAYFIKPINNMKLKRIVSLIAEK